MCGYWTYVVPQAESYFCPKTTYIWALSGQKKRVVIITIFIVLTHKCSEVRIVSSKYRGIAHMKIGYINVWALDICSAIG